MAFPLMSGAVIRHCPATSGHHLAMLYFSNSIGAAFGALAAAFWLHGWLGTPATMRGAGLANLALAALVLVIARRGEPASSLVIRTSGSASVTTRLVRLFVAAAFITGAASFIY